MKKWKCLVCGYIHTGDEPPDACPICGADKSQFVLIEELGSEPPLSEQAHPADAKDYVQPTASRKVSKESSSVPHPNRWKAVNVLLTKYHAHPIAVHIPNGVLPLATLLAILAVIFHGPSFATAAKYNTVFVFLAMPVVIITGIVDWKNRFKGRITRIFLVKFVCAGIVTILSGLLSLWWLLQPYIYQSGIGRTLLFILIYLINLCAATLAGWNGGKLVFKGK